MESIVPNELNVSPYSAVRPDPLLLKYKEKRFQSRRTRTRKPSSSDPTGKHSVIPRPHKCRQISQTQDHLERAETLTGNDGFTKQASRSGFVDGLLALEFWSLPDPLPI